MWLSSAALAVLVLLQAPGRIVPETKLDVLLDPVGIYADTVKDVVADGFTTAANLCTTAELKAACEKYGVS